jgi:hypothetical protein
MLPSKIKLTDEIIHIIKSTRVTKRISAVKLSRMINRDDSYISSFELKRLRTISSDDLLIILSNIFSISESEAILKAKELIGMECETGIRSNINTHIQDLPKYYEKGTITVSEPIEKNSYNSIKSDYTGTELIDDMLDTISNNFIEFYKNNPKEAVYSMKSFIQSMYFDPDFMMEIIGIPFYTLGELNKNQRQDVLEKMLNVFENYFISYNNNYHTKNKEG